MKFLLKVFFKQKCHKLEEEEKNMNLLFFFVLWQNTAKRLWLLEKSDLINEELPFLFSGVNAGHLTMALTAGLLDKKQKHQ